MTITDVRLARPGAEGTFKQDGREYTASWNVTTDDYRYQGKSIVDYFESNNTYDGSKGTVALPWYGRALDYGLSNDAGALCDNISPRLIDGSQFDWKVTAHFKSAKQEEEEQNEDENGDTTNDPTAWAPTLDVSFVEEVVPCEAAVYRDGFTFLAGEQPIYEPGDGEPGGVRFPKGVAIVNSANEMFDPAPERRRCHMLLRFGKYVEEFPDAVTDAFMAVNDKRVKFKIKDRNAKGGAIFSESFGALQLQIQSVNAAIVRKNNRTVWNVTTDILVALKDEDWRYKILDRGVWTLGTSGKADGNGGVLPAPQTGAPAARMMQDAFGNQITKPVFLNGRGEPNPPNTEHIYLSYSAYPEINYKARFDWLPIV